MSKITRRQAKHILAPMRQCFAGMLHTGQSETHDGYAMTQVGDEWERIDYCIAGFVALMARVFPDAQTIAMQRVEKTLSDRQLVKPSDLSACMLELKQIEDMLLTVTAAHMSSAVRTAQISFELEALAA